MFTKISNTGALVKIYIQANRNKNDQVYSSPGHLFLVLHIQDSSQRSTTFICIFKIQTEPAPKESFVFFKVSHARIVADIVKSY